MIIMHVSTLGRPWQNQHTHSKHTAANFRLLVILFDYVYHCCHCVDELVIAFSSFSPFVVVDLSGVLSFVGITFVYLHEFVIRIVIFAFFVWCSPSFALYVGDCGIRLFMVSMCYLLLSVCSSCFIVFFCVFIFQGFVHRSANTSKRATTITEKQIENDDRNDDDDDETIRIVMMLMITSMVAMMTTMLMMVMTMMAMVASSSASAAAL